MCNREMNGKCEREECEVDSKDFENMTRMTERKKIVITFRPIREKSETIRVT